MRTPPTVAIGLPVYNGEDYLAEAIESLLGQTFEDFEIVISDNASTDATESIGRRYEALDRRVRYVRSDRNLGAAHNFNKVFHLTDSPYFQWASHDNFHAPTFLEKCVAALERDPSLVLACAWARFVDEDSRLCDQTVKPVAALADGDPIARFRAALLYAVWVFEATGVIRTSALRKTSLIGSYYSSDRVLLAELSLLGRVHSVPEFLFFWRHHSEQSSSIDKTPQELARWISGRSPGAVVFPQWRIFTGYLRALQDAPLTPAGKVRGLAAIATLATRPKKLKRLVIPGPHNYFGIGAKRAAT